MNDEAFNRKIHEIEESGKSRFGEDNWKLCMEAIRRSTNNAGIPIDSMRQIASTTDPAHLLFTAGKEILLNESDNGNRESEIRYNAIRNEEREAHKRLRGRR